MIARPVLQPPRKRQLHMPADEWKRLLAVARSSSLRDHALIQLMYEGGLRASEVGKVTLERARYMKSRGQIYIERVKHGHSGWLELHPKTVAVLMKWARTAYPNRRPDNAPLFPGNAHRGLSRYAVFRIVQRLAQDAELPIEVSHPHALRHSRVMHLVETAADKGMALELLVPAVAQIVGHASAWTTITRYISETRGVKKHVADVTDKMLED